MVLVPVTGGKAISLVKDPFVIGRRVDCDLQIQDNAVSGRHCELRFDGQNWAIVDLKSRNGISVNGDPTQTQRLQVGDTIMIGPSLTLRFTHPRRETAVRWSRLLYRVLWIALVLAAVSGAIAAGMWLWNGGQ